MSKWRRSREGLLVPEAPRLCGLNVGPALFGGGGGAFSGPLDSYTTNLWTAVSIRRLLASWTGGAITLIRLTDNATTSIGYLSTGAIDSSAMSSFLGSANGFVRAWNNQQGTTARGFDGATNGKQPQIATAGIYDGKVAFDGSDDILNTGTSSGTPSAFTVFLRGKLRTTTGTRLILEHSTNYNGGNAAVAYYDAGALSVGVHDTTPGGYARSDFTGDFPNDSVHCYRFDRSQGSSAAMSVLFINGTKDTRNANGDSGTLPDSTFAAAVWYLGARSGSSLPAALDVHTLLIYEAALSDSDCTAISNIISALP